MTQATRACAHCGQQHQRTRAKYCTDLCARRAYTQARKADGRLATYRNRPEAKAKLRSWKQDNTERYKVERTCVVCGTVWKTQRKDAKYCTLACRDAAPRTASTTRTWGRRARARHAAAKAARGTRGRGILWAQGTCYRCGTMYVATYTRVLPKWCSRACADVDKWDRRRARERDAFVEDVRREEVFDRDGWTCGICGLTIDKTVEWPAPSAATIDHIIPLAGGGEHSMINVQAAHFRCNLIKSDQVIKGTMIDT